MKCYCKACKKDINVDHRRGSKDWFKWWRKHYDDKHGGYKKRSASKSTSRKKGKSTGKDVISRIRRILDE